MKAKITTNTLLNNQPIRVRIGEICSIDRQITKGIQDESCRYIGLEHVESNTGDIITFEAYEAIEGTCFLHDHRHVLYGKLRPYLNKVALPTVQGRCSMELVPLLPKEYVDRKYLAAVLRHPTTINYIMARATGARMPRADMDILLDYEIAIPPYTDRCRIVDILDLAASIKRLRAQAQAKVREIIPALFVDMFGDPATNPKGWPIVPVRDVLERSIRNGISPSRSGRFPGSVLTLAAITHGAFDITAVKDALFTAPISKDDEVNERDFLICRGNGNRDLVGRGVLPSKSLSGVAFPDTAMALRTNHKHILPPFLAAVWGLDFVRRQITECARTTNGTYKVNQEGMSAVKLLLPPVAIQQEFAERVSEIEAMATLGDTATQGAERLAQSLMSQVFGQTSTQT